MNLTDYPTPETDAAIYPTDICDVVWPEHARDLERRLAACREALKEILFIRQEPLPLVDLDEARSIAKRALTLTAPSTNPKP
jgi:hypothetical protein